MHYGHGHGVLHGSCLYGVPCRVAEVVRCIMPMLRRQWPATCHNEPRQAEGAPRPHAVALTTPRRRPRALTPPPPLRALAAYPEFNLVTYTAGTER